MSAESQAVIQRGAVHPVADTSETRGVQHRVQVGDPIVPFNWTKHTKTEFKAKLAESSIGGAIKPEFKVFQPIWIQEEYETVFGPPEDKHRFGVKQTWSYRCSDGTISLQVTADKGGSVIFSKILSE